MHRILIPVLIAFASIAALPSQDDVKKELKRFQGDWNLTARQEFDGKQATKDAIKDTTMFVDGEKFTLKQPGQLLVEGTFTIDPSKKIKTIDVILNGEKDRPVLGIYEIKGDKRRSCFSAPGQPRPDGFHKEAGYFILEWQQAK
jgi:uncharacterized protein (TIGR03067 family)